MQNTAARLHYYSTVTTWFNSCFRIRISFIVRYVCTYEEFVLETEAPRCDRMTATGQDTDNTNNNIQIFKIDDVQKKHKHNI